MYHSLLHPPPLSVFYLCVISLLFTLISVFIIFLSSQKKTTIENISIPSIFLCIYTLLIIWLGINKTIPEHQEILNFQAKRADLTYWLYKDEYDTLKALALLYMNAPPSVERVQPKANHFGTKIMRAYLEKQIKEGKGKRHYQDMYNLAEVAFIYSSRDIALTWYQNAQKYGKVNATKRYDERMLHYK